MKSFLKYVYALHVLVFLGYNQEFTRISGNFIGADASSFSEIYRPPANKTSRFQALVCEELKEKEDKDDNEHYYNDNSVAFSFDHIYRSVVGHTGGGTLGGRPLFCNKELGSLYLFFRALRL